MRSQNGYAPATELVPSAQTFGGRSRETANYRLASWGPQPRFLGLPACGVVARRRALAPHIIGISHSYCFNFLHPRHREPNSVMCVGFCKSLDSGYCFQNCCKNYLSNCAPMSVCCSLPRYLEISNVAGLPGHLAGYGLPDPCLAVPRCRSLIINPASRNPRLRRLHARRRVGVVLTHIRAVLE